MVVCVCVTVVICGKEKFFVCHPMMWKTYKNSKLEYVCKTCKQDSRNAV